MERCSLWRWWTELLTRAGKSQQDSEVMAQDYHVKRECHWSIQRVQSLATMGIIAPRAFDLGPHVRACAIAKLALVLQPAMGTSTAHLATVLQPSMRASIAHSATHLRLPVRAPAACHTAALRLSVRTAAANAAVVPCLPMLASAADPAIVAHTSMGAFVPHPLPYLM
mmetsp:Transcript_17580/g.36632  ORF Transcript_17580/g.36632 Transcript_17580/m.36632 type:complete len:168 (-) Transcript_17580:430-933(-)